MGYRDNDIVHARHANDADRIASFRDRGACAIRSGAERAHTPPPLCRAILLLLLCESASPPPPPPLPNRGLSTPLIKSQMNDISGAIISYRYYRDGYYVSRGVRSRVLSRSSIRFSFSLFFSHSRLLSLPTKPCHSLFSSPPPSSLPPSPPISGNTLTVACKESGHCAARKQEP